MLLLAFTIWHVMGTGACVSRGAITEHYPIVPYVSCSQLLFQSKNALIVGGMTLLSDAVYNQYMNQPPGPFVACFENIPTSENDTVGDMILSVHPCLPIAPLNELVSDTEERMEYFDLKLMTLLKNINNREELYNFTEPLNQFGLDASNTISLSKELNSFVGFIEDTGDGWVHCACQYTGVPDYNISHNIMNLLSNSWMPSQRYFFTLITSALAAAYF